MRISAEPTATAVTRPVGETVATASLLDDHVPPEPIASVAPSLYVATAVNGAVWPRVSDGLPVTATLRTVREGSLTVPPPPQAPIARIVQHSVRSVRR